MNMKDRMNACVKYREAYRPFAPIVLETEAWKWFDLLDLSRHPYMTMTVPVQTHMSWAIPAVVHVNGTARIQTVSPEDNPLLVKVLTAYHTATGIPMLLNTSFNLTGEPIVETPRDALRTFAGSGLDALVLGPFLVTKHD
jgi:carbamoyltransferase